MCRSAHRPAALLLSLCLVLAVGPVVRAQRQLLLDSLHRELRRTMPDTLRAQLLFQLGYELRRSQPDSSQAHAERALALSVLSGYERGRALAYRLLGIQAYFKGDYPRSLEHLQKGLLIFEQLGDVRGRAAVTYHIGAVFQRLGFFELAVQYYGRALPVFREHQMQTEYAGALNNMGEALLQQKAYSGARVNFQQSMALFEQLGEQQFVAENQRNLGEVALATGELDAAEKFFAQAHSSFARLANEIGMVAVGLNQAELALARRQPEAAVFQAAAALRLAEARGLRDRALIAHDILARAQAQRGFWREAYDHQARFKVLADSVQGAESAKRVALMEAEGSLNVERSKITLLTKENELRRFVNGAMVAVIALALVLVAVVLRNNRRQKQANRLLAERTDEIEYQRAVLAQRKMELEEANTRISAEADARRAANEELQATLDHLKQTQQQLILSEKMASLGRLVSNVAHELNTPLGVIHSSGGLVRLRLTELLHELPPALAQLTAEQRAWFDQLLTQASQSRAEALSTRQERQLLQALTPGVTAAGWPVPEQTATRMLALGYTSIDALPRPLPHVAPERSLALLAQAAVAAELLGSLQRISLSTDKTRRIVTALRLFATDTRTDYGPGISIATTLQQALETFANYLREDIRLEVDLTPGPTVVGHPDELAQVWGNLLLNAIQAVSGKGLIRVNGQLLPGPSPSYRVSISDDGPGIPTEYHPRLFEPFFTTKSRGEGSGLGLYVSRKIVENHGGQIELVSGPGATTAIVTLPVEPASLTPAAAEPQTLAAR